ncbi:hypothetical protein D1AOALGA4SA_12451 [Olavius algarvensis Delta 1 endosymbiont]|nr:hypothetical protein D1AOALGA4SA_12451 [Olavius algarvensis Delta 1 endosymbiont]
MRIFTFMRPLYRSWELFLTAIARVIVAGLRRAQPNRGHSHSKLNST